MTIDSWAIEYSEAVRLAATDPVGGIRKLKILQALLARSAPSIGHHLVLETLVVWQTRIGDLEDAEASCRRLIGECGDRLHLDSLAQLLVKRGDLAGSDDAYRSAHAAPDLHSRRDKQAREDYEWALEVLKNRGMTE